MIRKSLLKNLAFILLGTASCANTQKHQNAINESTTLDSTLSQTNPYEKILTISPDIKLYYGLTPGELFIQGQKFYEEGSYKDARDCFFSAWIIDAIDHELDNTYERGVLIGLTQSYTALGDIYGAVASYEMLSGERFEVEIDPSKKVHDKGLGLENHVRANLKANILAAQGYHNRCQLTRAEIEGNQNCFTKALYSLQPFLTPELATDMNLRLVNKLLSDSTVAIPDSSRGEFQNILDRYYYK
ncbi:MAG TPA: hypothetical protein VJH20_02360 [Candidatus Nanoarchaeia archaeon]|nr:hypothetical protein [Candidatus Nanoarchaeia archaeon]